MAECWLWWTKVRVPIHYPFFIVHIIAMSPLNIPPNEDHNSRDDGGQQDEASESAQSHNGSQVQAGPVRLLLVVVHRERNIYIWRLVRSGDGRKNNQDNKKKGFSKNLISSTNRILTLPAIWLSCGWAALIIARGSFVVGVL